MMRSWRWILVPVVVLLAAGVFAESYEGAFVKALAGDRVVVKHGEAEETVAVWGVACPLKKQPFADKAFEFTRNMLYQRSFIVKPVAKAPDGAQLVEINFSEGPNLSQELVRRGLAWADPKQHDGSLQLLEKEAREAGEGLWSKPNPVPPWEYDEEEPTKKK